MDYLDQVDQVTGSLADIEILSRCLAMLNFDATHLWAPYLLAYTEDSYFNQYDL